MSKILRTFIIDLLDETSEKYNIIFKSTKDETDNIKENYRYVFTGLTMIFGLIVALIASNHIEFTIGIILIFIEFIISQLILLQRQRKLKHIHNAYGEYIARIGQKRRMFLKIKKEINYWENVRADIVIKKGDYLTPKNIRTALHAIEIINYSYNLYFIEIFKKILPFVGDDMKSTIIRSIIISINKSVEVMKVLTDISTKPLPFYLRDIIYSIINDNKKYVPRYFKEPTAKSDYEFYVNYKDYMSISYGGPFNMIKKFGLRNFGLHMHIIKNLDFLLDENFNIVKTRIRQK